MKQRQAIALLAYTSLSAVVWGSAATAQTVNISHLQTDLQAAVCANNWDGALRAIAPLIGSPGITAPYRQELLQFRSQLQDWRAAESEFTNFPGCDGVVRVTTAPSNEYSSSQPLNWTRAMQNLEEMRSLPPGTIRLGF
jgi:hypothetical protein